MRRLLARDEHTVADTRTARGISLEQASVARAAAILFLAAGFLGALSAELGPAAGRSEMIVVALAAGAFGVAVWFAPWWRWRERASVWLAPIALIMIAIGSLSRASQAYDYALYFAIVHAWVGIAHPRWTSVKLAPVTAAAYLSPLVFFAPDPSRAALSGITVIPLCVLLGESIAWLRQRLMNSELDRGRLRSALLDGRRTEERLSFLAYHDAVTDLPNRAMFEEHFGVAIANAQRSGGTFSVCVVDLDKFKLINDTLGHASGDDVLREVAARLHSILRAGDVLARVGGDEFLLLLSFSGTGLDGDTNPADQARAATTTLMERMAEALSAPYVVADTEIRLSASFGSAIFPADSTDHDGLLAHADAEMYRRKRSRSQLTAAPSAYVDISLSDRLGAAVRSSPWHLEYQPIVELVLGRTVGAEALIRWPDAAGRRISPARFIPLAEEMGLISSIGAWIVDELEQQLRTWRTNGTLGDMVTLTTNVSPRQLWHPALPEMFGRLVDAAGRKDLVVIEITESTLGMDPARAQEILDEVRALGIRIALDDFGTGYSSLSRLRSLPIDIVKIDRAFTRDIETEPAARSLLRSTMRLIGSLDMVPLAEGVETQAQLDFLREEGCVLAQGFHLGRPAGPGLLSDRIKRTAEAVISLERIPEQPRSRIGT